MWWTVTANAKDLIQRLLDVDPTKRLSATQAMKHRWIRYFVKSVDDANAGFGNSAGVRLDQNQSRKLQRHLDEELEKLHQKEQRPYANNQIPTSSPAVGVSSKTG